jgi:hypothetical protein
MGSREGVAESPRIPRLAGVPEQDRCGPENPRLVAAIVEPGLRAQVHIPQHRRGAAMPGRLAPRELSGHGTR